MMNAIRQISVALTACLLCAQNALAIERLPVDDGGVMLVAALGLVAVIKIARTKGKR